MHSPLLSFPPQGGARSWGLPPESVVLRWGGVDYGEMAHCSPTGFDAAAHMLDGAAGVSRLVSGFFPKRIDSCVVVESLCPRGGASLQLSTLPSC